MQTSVVMPQLGESVTEGTVERWLKRAGEFVRKDEPLLEVVTDKVNAEVPSPVAGTLRAILVPEGRTVPCRTALALIEAVDEGQQPGPGAATTAKAVAPAAPEGPPPAPAVAPEAIRPPTPSESAPEPRPSPPARPDRGRRPEARPAPAHPPTARAAPQATLAVEIDLTGLARLRRQHGAAFRRRHGIELTDLPFLLQAVTAVLAAQPLLNAAWDEGAVRRQPDIHLGLALPPEGGSPADSLPVAVIRHADRLDLLGLARAAAELIERARLGALAPAEPRGATFTVQHRGALGAVFSTPLLPPSQAGTLTLEAAVKRPVALATADGGESLAIRHLAWCCLSVDLRVVDEPAAGRFLRAVKERLERATVEMFGEGE